MPDIPEETGSLGFEGDDADEASAALAAVHEEIQRETKAPTPEVEVPAETAPAASTPAAPTPKAAPETALPSAADAKASWEQRSAGRDELKAALARSEREKAEYREYLNAMLNQQQPTEEEEFAREPYFDLDPNLKGALDHQTEQVQEIVRPLIETQQQQQEAAEVAAEEQTARAAIADWQGEILQAEQEYAATQEGQGYHERVQAYDDNMRGALSDLGVDESVAKDLVARNFIGLASLARTLNVQPAILVDTMIRRMGIEANGNGAATPAAPAAASADVAAAAAAIADGVTTDQPTSRTAPASELDIDVIMDQGISPRQIAQMRNEGGDFASKITRLALEAEATLED